MSISKLTDEEWNAMVTEILEKHKDIFEQIWEDELEEKITKQQRRCIACYFLPCRCNPGRR